MDKLVNKILLMTRFILPFVKDELESKIFVNQRSAT